MATKNPLLRFVTPLYLIKCLKLFKKQRLLPKFAFISGLPPNMSQWGFI